MVFSSLPFLFLFLPLCLGLYYIVPGIRLLRSGEAADDSQGDPSTGWKNGVLLFMSLLFYALGEPVYVLLMVFCAFVGWGGGMLIYRCRRRKRSYLARPVLIVTVVLTTGALFLFKYCDFLMENLGLLLHRELPLMQLTMPIGISFYTFQILTYDIDLYRKKTKVQKSFPTFLLYVSLFPQLIAGPILRYDDVALQLRDRQTTASGFVKGISRFLTGCAKKAVIANSMGEIIDLLWGEAHDPSALPVLVVWLGVLCYTLQIYFDFSGYSDMAIGLGKMFGFTYKENFDHPYTAVSVTDFWRRWHISLSSFFRDYVYIPLGGNRRHQLLNLFVVWTLTGFWHGAAWNYLLWGFYYFVLLSVEKLVLHNALERVPVLNRLLTLFFVMVGWTIFYFEDIGLCFGALRAMFGLGSRELWLPLYTTMIRSKLSMILLAMVFCLPLGELAAPMMRRLRKRSRVLWLLLTLGYHALTLLLSVSFLVSSTYNPFLYFRF